MQEQNRDISILKQRILQYLENKGEKKSDFYKNTGISNGVLSQTNGLSEDNLLKFLNYYRDINTTWLLNGKGPMYIEKETPNPNNTLINSADFFSYLRERDSELRKLIIENCSIKSQIETLKKGGYRATYDLAAEP